jgi:O-antigen ligase
VSASSPRLGTAPPAGLGRFERGAGGGIALVLVASGLGLLAVRSPAAAAGLAGVGAVVVLAARSLAAAVAVFAALSFLAGVPFVDEGGALRLASVALVLAALVALSVEGVVPALARIPPLFAVCTVMLGTWAFASVLWAADEQVARAGVVRLVQLLVLAIIVAVAVRDAADLRLVALGFVAGAVLTTVMPLVGIGSSTGAGTGRFGGDLGNPNNLAAVLLPALALTVFMALGTARVGGRILLLACAAVLTYGFLRTESRGGLVGLLAMTVAAALLAGPVRRQVATALALVATLGVVFFAVAAPAARHHVTDFSAADTTGRSDLWALATNMAANHPIQGIGLDNFGVVSPAYLDSPVDVERADLVLDGTQVHNTYLNMLTELGVVGLLAFLGLVGGAVALGLSSLGGLSRTERADELLARGVVVGAIGMFVSYGFFSAQFEKQFWIVLGMLVALPGLVPVRRRSEFQAGATPDEAPG